jgi:asparagine synthetase B (glutamine-hydrolysing)
VQAEAQGPRLVGYSGLYQHEGNFLVQQGLAIVSPLSGDQPLFNEDRTVVVVVRCTAC